MNHDDPLTTELLNGSAAAEAYESAHERRTIRARGFSLLHATELEPRAPEWLVRDRLERDSLALVFGDPGTGKSFLAVAWAASVATGAMWFGHRVRQAPVIYVAGEGRSGIARRLRAWSVETGISLEAAPLYVSTGPVAMRDPMAAAEMEAAVDEIARTEGAPGLIVLDTLARNFGPGDENSTADMTEFVAVADRMRVRYDGATVLLVHHSGHSDKSRARGAMALKAALDTEFLLTKDEGGTIRMLSTKTKDSEPPEPMAFKLRGVELPGLVDSDGRPVSSAVLDALPYEVPGAKGKKPQGKWQAFALDRLTALLREQKGTPDDGDGIPERTWHRACLDAGMPRQRWAEILEALTDRDLVTVDERGNVGLP